ncbi:hypothetical protein KFK09_009032 [Dendrobium nobile]|uniref:Uncharacterized protein n=1 Tax=Dendrobium nobile TaxID=94219 RepID=A0A8T3BPB7_DENNO|nr:hypothetical protein KFK09_009032 [Dendrobium nobile]
MSTMFHEPLFYIPSPTSLRSSPTLYSLTCITSSCICHNIQSSSSLQKCIQHQKISLALAFASRMSSIHSSIAPNFLSNNSFPLESSTSPEYCIRSCKHFFKLT